MNKVGKRSSWQLLSGGAHFLSFDSDGGASSSKLSAEAAVYNGPPLPGSHSAVSVVRGRLRFPNVKPQQVLDLIVNLESRP